MTNREGATSWVAGGDKTRAGRSIAASLGGRVGGRWAHRGFCPPTPFPQQPQGFTELFTGLRARCRLTAAPGTHTHRPRRLYLGTVCYETAADLSVTFSLRREGTTL